MKGKKVISILLVIIVVFISPLQAIAKRPEVDISQYLPVEIDSMPFKDSSGKIHFEQLPEGSYEEKGHLYVPAGSSKGLPVINDQVIEKALNNGDDSEYEAIGDDKAEEIARMEFLRLQEEEERKAELAELEEERKAFTSSFQSKENWQVTPFKLEMDTLDITQSANDKNKEYKKAVTWESPVIYDQSTYGLINCGTIIPATLLTGLNSDLPGHLIAQVSEPVCDTSTGRKILIPQGARLFGEYSSKVIFGQKRPMVRWTKVILPDGSTIDLQNMAGYDKKGYAGFKANVNNHYFPMFASAAMISLFAWGADKLIAEDTQVTITNPVLSIGDEVPVGSISMWSTNSAPSGYLMCDGKEFDPVTYPALHELFPNDHTPLMPQEATGQYYIIKAQSRGLTTSILSGVSQTIGTTSNTSFKAEVAKSFAREAEKVLSKYLEQAPTLIVKTGYRFSVIVNRELVLPTIRYR